VYGKRISDISFFVGDNCNVNHCIANIAQKPLIECYSHKFNLAIEEYLMKYENILDKVHILMVKLRNIKNRGKLRKLQCPYQSVKRNDTRWSSTFEMLLCFINIRSYAEQIDEVQDYLLSMKLVKVIEALMVHLKVFETLSASFDVPGINFSDTYLSQLSTSLFLQNLFRLVRAL